MAGGGVPAETPPFILKGLEAFSQVRGPTFVQFLPQPGGEPGAGTGTGKPRHQLSPPY
jgi:hypothetical protein